MKCEVWISEKEKGVKTINKSLKRPYDGHIPERTFLIGEDFNYSIEEVYIEDDGSILCSLNGSNGLYFSITIPFEEWVFQLMRFESLDRLEKVLKNKNKEMLQIQNKLEVFKKEFNTKFNKKLKEVKQGNRNSSP